MATTVLVCDDEEPLRALVRASLSDFEHEVFEARDGDESLELARKLHPDVILLDMMMPGRSGLEVLRALRADPDLAATPVIVLTARTQLADRDDAAEAGADRFVTKPFSPLALASVVADVLGRE